MYKANALPTSSKKKKKKQAAKMLTCQNQFEATNTVALIS